MFQTKEQDKTPETNPNEAELSDLPVRVQISKDAHQSQETNA